MLINTFILVGIYLLIQVFSPSKYIRLIKSFFESREEREKNKEAKLEVNKKNNKIREQHFEVF